MKQVTHALHQPSCTFIYQNRCIYFFLNKMDLFFCCLSDITSDYDSCNSCYLCCYADRAGVEVTFPHHGTAQGDEWSGGESVFIRSQHGCHHHITT